MKDINQHKDLEKSLKEMYLSKEENALREKWAKQLNDDYDIKKEPAPASKKYLYLLILGLIVAATGMLTYKYFTSDSSKDTKVDLQIAKLEVLSHPIYSHRGATNQDGEDLSLEAYNNLVAEEYESALSKYESIKELNDYDNYHLALTYLKLNKNKEVIKLLENFNQKEHKYSQESKWMLALSYLNDNNTPKAKTVLKEIVVKNLYNNKNAQELLNTIE